MSLCIGLTGGIASGKSTVASEFEKLEVPVIDADHVAREVVAPNSDGLKAVIDEFGPAFLDAQGQLDRARMRELIFRIPEKRQTLEGILHPLIRQSLKTWRHALQAPYGLMMVPILIEGGFDVICDRILVVDVPEDTQIERLRNRDGGSETDARRILAAQVSRAERLSRADDVIENLGSAKDLTAKVEKLHRFYRSLAQSAG